MIASSLIGVLCGLLLGSRFKVYSLIIAHALALVMTVALGLWTHASFAQSAIGLLCWSMTLQIGYVGMLIASSRSGRAALRATTHGA